MKEEKLEWLLASSLVFVIFFRIRSYMVKVLRRILFVSSWVGRYGLRGGRSQRFCDNSTKASVIRSVTMGKGGRRMIKIARSHLWTIPKIAKLILHNRQHYDFLDQTYSLT
jgi:hypothetical protein